MNSGVADKAGNLRKVYEQCWLHARHNENERLWFTNIYALVVGGALAFMSQAGLNWYIPSFLIGFSLIGLLMCHALRIPWIKYSRMAEIIMRREWQLADYSVIYPRDEQASTYGSGETKKRFSLHGAFCLFYMFMFALSVIFLVQAVGCKHIIGNSIAGAVSFAGIFLVYRKVLVRIEEKAHLEMGELDRKKATKPPD